VEFKRFKPHHQSLITTHVDCAIAIHKFCP
jgi:hypothetical protein